MTRASTPRSPAALSAQSPFQSKQHTETVVMQKATDAYLLDQSVADGLYFFGHVGALLDQNSIVFQRSGAIDQTARRVRHERSAHLAKLRLLVGQAVAPARADVAQVIDEWELMCVALETPLRRRCGPPHVG